MPSFSIEAEGESTPLSAQTVLTTLSYLSSASVNQQLLQVATKQLGNWEKVPGYYSLLQDVYCNFAVNYEVRFQAVIQLKNGIDKYWRKTSNHAIGKAEKDKIKSRAIDVGVQEPQSSLSLQNALMIAKIARYEFPHDWPNVITTLTHHLRSASNIDADPTLTSNILCITLQVVKELASGRLQRMKKSLQSAAPELLVVITQLYVNLVQRWSSSIGHITDMTHSHSALKTIRRLVVAGFEHPHRDTTVKELWELVQDHHERVWIAWQQESDKDKTETKQLAKHFFQYMKLYLDMSRDHPASFVHLGCMGILIRSWTIVNDSDTKVVLSGGSDWIVHRSGDTIDEGESPIEKLALKALLLFRACLKMVFQPAQTFKYQHPEDKADRKEAINQVRTMVFTDVLVIQMMEILVTHYFVLRPQDLREWEQEPDEWERREEEIADAWEFSIRSCAEKLFLDLVINFKDLLVPRLLAVFAEYATLDNRDVLLKDSLYSAFGIAAACIENVFDINNLIDTVLVPEVQLDLPNYQLLRRRIAILIGQWVPIKAETIDRPKIYQIFVFLLSPTQKLNDHVVRVTAGRQLRLVLEPFEFHHEEFEPHAAAILSSMMNLIAETESPETKMALLETVRVAVTKLEGHIEPYADSIMSMLSSLWEESGEEHLMKQAVLTMITTMVTSLGNNGSGTHRSVLRLIYEAVQPDSETSVYLLEEALELWAAVLQQTSSTGQSPPQGLIDLSYSLLPLLELGSEHLRQCFELIESYTILSPATILDERFLTPLLSSLKGLLTMLTSSRARNAAQAPHIVENIMAAIALPANFNEATRAAALHHLVATMIETGYLGAMLSILKEAYDYHQDPRPNLKPPEVIGVGETSLYNVLARIAVMAPDLFLQALDAVDDASRWIVPEWIGQFDAIGDILRKKLQIIGLSNLFLAREPPPRIMLESLQSLMGIWADIMTQLADGAADDNHGDYLWAGPSPALPDWPNEPPEDARRRAISNNDPTYTINLRTHISNLLQRVIANTGGLPTFQNEWLSRVDSAVLRSFHDLNIL